MKSRALSREVVVTSGMVAAGELTALVAAGVAGALAAVAIVAGLVEAKRIVAPFRIKGFDLEN